MQRVIAWCLYMLIKYSRPLLGSPGCCRYTVSCTDYALMLLDDVQQFGNGLLRVLWLIFKRVVSCHPFKASKMKKLQ